MKIARWTPREDTRNHFERPYLEAPSPYDYLPPERSSRLEEEEEEEEEAPRVIIIEM